MVLSASIIRIVGSTSKYMRLKVENRILKTIRRFKKDDHSKSRDVDPKANIKQITREHLYPTYIQYISSLNVQSKVNYTRRAGIICTIGPSSKDVEVLIKMMEAGMGIARLNFSHGTHEFHKELMENIREAVKIRSEDIGSPVPVAIALDTKGPEIRSGLLAKGRAAEVVIKTGSVLTLHTEKSYYDKGTASDIYVDYLKLPKIVSAGSNIFIDDGLIHLRVLEVDKTSIKCSVITGGLLGGQKGINLPGLQIDLPAVTEKDKEDILFGIENDIDIIFASFIRNKEDVKSLRKLLGKAESIQVVAKIENLEGIENVDEIIHASDGIMVARGDLGIEIPTERVFLAQKRMIASCNLAGKPVICATQMLESMTKRMRPTRAESTDVGNAILDGADCVMLSGETAKGKFPVECVKVMSSICRAAEVAVQHLKFFQEMNLMIRAPTDTTQSMAIAAVAAAHKVLASAILVMTTTGYSAFVVAKFRPSCTIIAITSHPHVARKCCLHRAIIPVIHTKERLKDWSLYTEDRIKTGLHMGLTRGRIQLGDRVIVLTGWKRGKGNTNTMRIVQVTAELMDDLLKINKK